MAQARDEWRASQGELNPERLVFIDETGGIAASIAEIESLRTTLLIRSLASSWAAAKTN